MRRDAVLLEQFERLATLGTLRITAEVQLGRCNLRG